MYNFMNKKIFDDNGNMRNEVVEISNIIFNLANGYEWKLSESVCDDIAVELFDKGYRKNNGVE